MSKQRWWLVAEVAGVLALVAMIAWPRGGLQVETAAVSRGRIAVTVDEEGRTRLRDLYVVASPVDGRIERIAVREGDRVSAGDLLARVHPSPMDPRAAGVFRGQLEAAQAQRLEAAAELQKSTSMRDQATRDLERARRLLSGGAVSEEAVEQARLAASAAGRDLEGRKASLQAAEAGVASARAALIGLDANATGAAAVEVRAPVSGRVLRVLQQSARVTPAGSPLLELGDAAGLEAQVDVLSEDAVKIQSGNPVTIDQWGGDRPLSGRVRLVEPEAFTKISALGVEEQRVHVLVDLIGPPPSLGVGYRVEAHIEIWSGESVLSVPTSALFRLGGRWAAFAVREGRAERRSLRLGHQSAEAAEVLEGLSEGDLVILYPSALIEDGVRVR